MDASRFNFAGLIALPQGDSTINSGVIDRSGETPPEHAGTPDGSPVSDAPVLIWAEDSSKFAGQVRFKGSNRWRQPTPEELASKTADAPTDDDEDDTNNDN